MASAYTYEPPPAVTGSPTSGATAGGTSVTITGTDFVNGGTVTLGGAAATNVTFGSATSLTATTPSGSAGTADVVVTNPDTQTGTQAGGFTYWPDNEPSGLVLVFPGHPTVPGVLVDDSELYLNYTSQGGSDLGSSCSFGGKWDGTRILSTTSPGSKYGKVIRKNMLIGDTEGWSGLAWDDEFAADYETLYFRFVFKLSSNCGVDPFHLLLVWAPRGYDNVLPALDLETSALPALIRGFVKNAAEAVLAWEKLAPLFKRRISG